MASKTELYLYKPNSPEVANVTNETVPECAICYKRINKDVFICSEPCNKIFHPNCIERMMDETAFGILHRCCYCRREIQMESYMKEVYINALMKMKAGGYCVNEALQMIELNGVNQDEGYAIYLLMPMEYVKKPKQAKKIKLPKHFLKIQRKNVMHHSVGRKR